MSPVESSDPDELFNEIVKDVDVNPVGSVVDFSTLSDRELVIRYNKVRAELHRRGEMFQTKTQVANVLHSEMATIWFHLKGRRLL